MLQKKITAIVTIFILIAMILTSCKGFHDYYYPTLDDAREPEKLYETTDEFFTVDADTAVLDFIIEEKKIHVIEIERKNSADESRYKVRRTSSYLLKEEIAIFNQKNDYYWTNSTKFSFAEYSWCVVTKDFNDSHDNVAAFEFEFENECYALCYLIAD